MTLAFGRKVEFELEFEFKFAKRNFLPDIVCN